MNSTINWKEFMAGMHEQVGRPVALDSENIPSNFIEIKQVLDNAKFNSKSITWYFYAAGMHFPEHVVNQFAEEVNCKVCKAWVSRLDPGDYAPWHWDMDDNEEEYLKQGTLKRFTVFIHEPSFGQVLFVENRCYYNQTTGTVIEWPSYKNIHASANAGLHPQYLFHFLGIVN